MENDKTILELIEEYAGLFLTIDEISLLLDLDPIQLKFRPENQIRPKPTKKAN